MISGTSEGARSVNREKRLLEATANVVCAAAIVKAKRKKVNATSKKQRIYFCTYDILMIARGRVTDCGVRGLWFKSPGSILTSRTETSSLSRVVRDG